MQNAEEIYNDKTRIEEPRLNSVGSSNERKMFLKVARLLPPLEGRDLRRAGIVLISKFETNIKSQNTMPKIKNVLNLKNCNFGFV